MRTIAFYCLFIIFLHTISSFVPGKYSEGRLIDQEKFVADTGNTDGQTYALIIGISNYKYIRPLTYADRDAELFRDFLRSSAGGNLPNDNVFCLLNEEAKAGNFWVKGMNWLRTKNMKKGDRLYIYMAGHGDAINQDEYFFLTYDCNPAGDKNNYLITGNIQLYNLKSRIGELVRKDVEVFLIMDACRSNELPGGADGQNLLNSAISERKTGEVIMLATGAGQESLEDAKIGTGHGLFTYYLVDGLSGLADQKGNNDKKVTLLELQQYIKQHVPIVAQEKYNKKQDPFFCCDEYGDKRLAFVDSAFLNKWSLIKQLKDLSGSEMDAMARSVALRSASGTNSDTVFLENYYRFTKAIKQVNLSGSDSSAEHYFLKLSQLDPKNSLTKEARLTLASEFINFAQTKINLYLQGKDVTTIQQLRTQVDEDEESEDMAIILSRMDKIARLEFSHVGNLLEKSINYLEPQDSVLIRSLTTRIYFFKAHGYFDKGNKTMDYAEAMRYARLAIQRDNGAAYTLNTIASLFIHSNKPDSAIYYARQAIDVAPQWRYPYLNMAYAFSKLNRKDSSKTYYLKAISIDSTNADAYVDIGRFYYNNYQVDSAVLFYHKALQIDKNNIYANNNMGWILKQRRDYDNSLKYFKQAVQIEPNFFNAYNGISKVYSEIKQLDSARFYYQKAFQQYPDKALTTNYIGNFYKKLKQYDTAIVYYKNAIDYDVTDNIPLINLGNTFVDLKKYDSAVIYFQKAIAISSNAFVFNQLGLLYKQLKQYDSATTYFSRSFDANNDYTYALNNLALSYYEQKKLDQAKTYFAKAIARQPNSAALYNNAGLVFKEGRSLDSAKNYFTRAIELNPGSLPAYGNLGWLYREQRKYDSAKLYFKQATDLAPRDGDALNNLILLFKYLDQYDSARLYYIKSIMLDPQNPVAINKLGSFYFDMKGYDSAIVTFQRAIKIDPAYAVAYNNMGATYNELAFYDSAIYFCKKAIQLDPEYTSAYFNLGMSFYNKAKYDSSIVYLTRAIALNPQTNYYYFYLAMGYSMKKQAAESIANLRIACEKGFKDFYTFLHDPDLSFVRKTKEYDALVKEFVPESFVKQLEEDEKRVLEEAKKVSPPAQKKKN